MIVLKSFPLFHIIAKSLQVLFTTVDLFLICHPKAPKSKSPTETKNILPVLNIQVFKIGAIRNKSSGIQK